MDRELETGPDHTSAPIEFFDATGQIFGDRRRDDFS
jgi:hypothetical protein